MSEQQSTYRNIIKSTSIFGGVQVYQILINLIKAKFVALFLGVVGMGISGLLVSTLAIVNSIAGLGLSFSATREIAQASHENNAEKLNKIHTIFSRWLYFTSIAGVIIVILFSHLFSKYAFGNRDYTWAFVWLSVTILLNVLTSKNNTLLQGTRRIKDLAKSSVIGSTVGLFTSIPLYYFWGKNGIVPALIIAALTSFLVSQFFAFKVRLSKINLTLKQTISGGSEMVKLGIIMMVATLMGSIVIFAVNAYISKTGSLADVGLYNAGIAITSQFIGLVFTAMSMDYFPRLAAISTDNSKVCEMVNQQSEITILIILPLLILMILTSPLLIRILLTSEFLKLTNFIRMVAFGTIFQAAAFTISYIPLAKGDKKNYFIWNALFNNIFGIIILITGYKLYGLNGLAIALIIHHLVSFLVFVTITRNLYNYKMSKFLLFYIIISIFLIGCVLIFVFFYPNIYGYSLGVLFFIFATAFSLYNIDKLIDIRMSINAITNKFKEQKL